MKRALVLVVAALSLGFINYGMIGRTSAPPAPPFVNTYSLYFDGIDAYLNLGAPSGMSGTLPNPSSACLWAKQDDLAAQHYLLSRSRPFTPVITAVLAYNTDSTAFTYAGGAGSSTSGGVISTTWHSLCLTRGATAKLYLDGSQIGGTIGSVGTDDATVDWLVGASRNLGDNSDAVLHHKGNIDEVSMWDAELTSGQVSELHNGGAPSNLATHSAAASLIHWWRMGDGVADAYPDIQDQVTIFDTATMSFMAPGDIVADVP